MFVCLFVDKLRDNGNGFLDLEFWDRLQSLMARSVQSYQKISATLQTAQECSLQAPVQHKTRTVHAA